MTKTIMRGFAPLLGVALLGVTAGATRVASAAEDHCFYKGAMFSDGAASCQSGRKYRCDDGDWKSMGDACSDEKLASSRRCDFDGIAYSTGSASCQSGTQYRCEDGS